MNWEEFLDPYVQAVGELKVKFRGMRKQFQKKNRHSPIEFVTGRVKPIESIKNKAKLRGVKKENLEQEMQDIAGIRIMVQFVEDVEEVLELLRDRKDFKIIQERDYIKNQKASGYRSYHVVIEYPVETIDGRKLILAEIQIRTLAMNFWATIEHSLNYKYQGEFPEELKERIAKTAKIAYALDEEMSQIREEIQEAQLLFNPPANKLNDGVGNSDDNDEYYRW
ncbi:GTP pyrophosphokinase [Floricoccus tropicus]|uniref:GTP pyrophosphokinase n=1 Tax=Floricoccus tropicus TaxID=1859473 RepID=A0A1E8GJ76_9LACT|nr:GTP pyrophosphokinase family protein [Floricoccus tropicus]OFI48281.1 GTP pyrophosphokinase [Floricoccus tropicus]